MKIVFANQKRGGIAAYYFLYALISIAFGIFALPIIVEQMYPNPRIGLNTETVFLFVGVLFLLSVILHCLQIVIWGGLGIDIIEINEKEILLRRKYRRQKWQLRPIALKVNVRDVSGFAILEELDNILDVQRYKFPEIEGYSIQIQFAENRGGAFGLGQGAVFGKKMQKDRAIKKIAQLNSYLSNLKNRL